MRLPPRGSGAAAGKSRTSLTDSLALTHTPEAVRNLCRLADISFKSLLLQVVRQDAPEKMTALVEKIASQGGHPSGRARRRGAREARAADALRVRLPPAGQAVQPEAELRGDPREPRRDHRRPRGHPARAPQGRPIAPRRICQSRGFENLGSADRAFPTSGASLQVRAGGSAEMRPSNDRPHSGKSPPGGPPVRTCATAAARAKPGRPTHFVFALRPPGKQFKPEAELREAGSSASSKPSCASSARPPDSPPGRICQI